jgi:MoaA/NifB/PqqE/SkfB family radical SAM enzyme
VKVVLKNINISINPLYGCNFRCGFCYLTKDQLSDFNALDLNLLEKRLKEVSESYRINQVDLYGGEVSLLGQNYIVKLKSILKKYTNSKLNIITNFSRPLPAFFEDDVTLSVSWDYDSREEYQKVYNNILMSEKEIHILLLATPEVIAWSDEKLDTVINYLNGAKCISSLEVKPYSSNQSNQIDFDYQSYEGFIKRLISKKEKLQFQLVNEKLILESLAQTNNSWSDDHIYINPKGEYSVLDFDENYNEYFSSLASLPDYDKWCKKEKEIVLNSPLCNSCDYLGSCLSEHLKGGQEGRGSCDGFKDLIHWYGENYI